jgi:hypothetical protein
MFAQVPFIINNMATLRQQKLARNIVSGRFTTLKGLLVFTGYSAKTAEAHPQVIVSQKGVKEELRRLGYDDLWLTAKAALVVIMYASKSNMERLKAADIVARALGMYK